VRNRTSPRTETREREICTVREFTTDITSLRDAARKNIDEGAITDAYGADRSRVIEVLNDVLATELVCVLRYKRHYYMATGMKSLPVAAEFLEHAAQEQDHADRVAERIVQLQGEPDLNPATLTSRSHAEYVAGTDLADMITEDLIAERIAIASYQDIARWLGDDDPTSRRLIESLLEVEEEHAEDLSSLLSDL
jgi:bacterioferritin